MTTTAARDFSRRLRDSLKTHSLDALATCLDENVEWSLYGPIDLFPFFGTRKGRGAVLAAIRELTQVLELRHYEPEHWLISGAQAAALTRVGVRIRASGRILTVRMAQFITLRDGKLASIKLLLDTLDTAEQVLGRELDLSRTA
ncbi:MAG TPA: nuclear transport factor 2 family protein [Pseudolabrys sp.]|nr:nuclear transport factor 2 family protein [Pseudolabrys sp.]